MNAPKQQDSVKRVDRWVEHRAKYRKDPANWAKLYARKSVANALKSGQLVRSLSCESCGETTAVEAHHEDYSKPRVVKWLCRKCHCEVHWETHCKHGHELTPENIYMRPNASGRDCRTCRALSRKKIVGQ